MKYFKTFIICILFLNTNTVHAVPLGGAGNAVTEQATVFALEETTTPTPVANVGKVYTKNDDILYFQDGAGTEHIASGTRTFKSYTFKSRDAASGEHYVGGFYNAPVNAAFLTQALVSTTHGSANHPYAAHAFIVSGGNGTTDGSDLVLTVSGTSIDDDGTRTGGDSEVIEATAEISPLNTYFETTKKWLGQITFTLSSTAGTGFDYAFNYGFVKYEDMGNRDFILTDFECTGQANQADAGFEIELLYHEATAFVYNAGAFDPNATPLLSMNTIHGVEEDLTAGEQFAFKRAGLSTAINGGDSEGIIIKITTGANNSITYMNCHVGTFL